MNDSNAEPGLDSKHKRHLIINGKLKCRASRSIQTDRSRCTFLKYFFDCLSAKQIPNVAGGIMVICMVTSSGLSHHANPFPQPTHPLTTDLHESMLPPCPRTIDCKQSTRKRSSQRCLEKVFVCVFGLLRELAHLIQLRLRLSSGNREVINCSRCVLFVPIRRSRASLSSILFPLAISLARGPGWTALSSLMGRLQRFTRSKLSGFR